MEIQSLVIASAFAFGCALAGCSLLRVFSLRRNLLDQPNERSLHSVPVPRLGGVAIACATWLALLVIHALRKTLPERLEVAWLVTSLPIAALGLIDDLQPLRAGTRLVLQFACAGAFCALAGIPTGISLLASSRSALPAPLSLALCSFFIVAGLNLSSTSWTEWTGSRDPRRLGLRWALARSSPSRILPR